MTHDPADPQVSGGRSTVRETARIRPAALGCAVSVGLLALYAAWELAFGHFRFATEHPWASPEMLGPRIALTVIVLTGFMVGGYAYGRREIVRDVEDLGPVFRGSVQQHDAFRREAASSDGLRGWVGSLVAVPIGLLVVTSRNAGGPYLMSDEPWDHDVVWALGCNVLLFSILGRIAVGTFRHSELFARIEASLGPVDLLRPYLLAPFARRGLRIAFLWIGGSSIASIIFVNQRFSWLTGLVLVGTMLLGTFAFVLPVRGLHQRIRTAKAAELERVRDVIDRVREALLSGAADTTAAARMPGLLAYEHRVTSVSEWPLGSPQFVRFGLMIALGLGSWLGAALVEHLVEVF